MPGKGGGIQKFTFFFHCFSNKLGLVINNLNAMQQIQSTAETTKEVINIISEST